MLSPCCEFGKDDETGVAVVEPSEDAEEGEEAERNNKDSAEGFVVVGPGVTDD